MSYFADLTPYSYFEESSLPDYPQALNIGWLSADHEYPKGEVPPELLEKLRTLSRTYIVNGTRGFHICELCTPPGVGAFDPSLNFTPGNGEIWVASETEVFYAAPMLAIHYIEAHHYRPPEVFLDALRNLDVSKVGDQYKNYPRLEVSKPVIRTKMGKW